MINSTLERQTKSIDERLCRLIEERDEKNLMPLMIILLRLLALLVLLKPRRLIEGEAPSSSVI
jgi:hypothetical protein